MHPGGDAWACADRPPRSAKAQEPVGDEHLLAPRLSDRRETLMRDDADDLNELRLGRPDADQNPFADGARTYLFDVEKASLLWAKSEQLINAAS